MFCFVQNIYFYEHCFLRNLPQISGLYTQEYKFINTRHEIFLRIGVYTVHIADNYTQCLINTYFLDAKVKSVEHCIQ